MDDIKLDDIYLKDHDITDRVGQLRRNYFNAFPQIDIERAKLITEYSVKNGLLGKESISVLDKAMTYRHVLKNREPIIQHSIGYENGMKKFELNESQLFAGSTTSKYKGVPLYPEFLALSIWPELWTISDRKSNPYQISDKDVKVLNEEIFPHWINNSIFELGRSIFYDGESKKDITKAIQLLQYIVFFIVSKPNCISHTIPDFSKAIYKGMRSIINEAENKKANTSDKDKKDFYQAIIEVQEGIIEYSKNLAAKAQILADNEKDQKKKDELLKMVEIHTRIPEKPARNFREGLTTMWLCWVACHLENPNVGLSLGRLDQVLYELYRKDIDSGNLSVSDAIELVCCLWLKIGDHVPTVPEAGEKLFGGTGSNQAITIGGVDKEGKDAVNKLTYVMLRATEMMMLRDPNLNARYYSGVNSKNYLKRLCDANIETKATPALHNDKAVIKALMSKGETKEQAMDYGLIGCVEPGSNGRFYGSTGTILLNLTSVLELTLFNGCHRHTGLKPENRISIETGDPRDFASFDEFKEAFKKQAEWMVHMSTSLNNHFGRVHQHYYPTPILSSLFEGPMEKGKDLIDGGAVINSSGAAIIGLADVADSLTAIQKVVFEGNHNSFDKLIKAINKNFDGYDSLYKELLKAEKYGNDNDVADANTKWITKLFDELYGKTENYRGGRYRVGYWSMTNHAGFGRISYAIPSGRKDKMNFASGITPESGKTHEITKTLNSVAKMAGGYSSNGMAFNIKYTPGSYDNREEMIDKFASYVEGYFDTSDGHEGMEIQFNVADHNTFIDAAKNPDKYNELLVRVSGYTAYFVDLNPRMQQEIINRTEYNLKTGAEVPYPRYELEGGE